MTNNNMNNANLNNSNLDMNEFAKLVAKSMLDMVNTPIPTADNDNSVPAHGKYFGKTICGEVYNPRTTRRWISAQFIRLMRQERVTTSINQVIANFYTYKYSILYTCKEAKLLAHLKDNDPVAFEERKHFFDVNSITDIFMNFAKEFKPSLQSLINTAWSYSDFAVIAEAIELVIAKRAFDIPEGTGMKGGRYFKNHKLANAFIRSFKKAGAYYTLKNYIMFDRRFILHWFDEVYTRENALRKLRLEIQAPDYYFYKALKVSMAENYISLSDPFANME